jgi:predicted aminopeptidase
MSWSPTLESAICPLAGRVLVEVGKEKWQEKEKERKGKKRKEKERKRGSMQLGLLLTGEERRSAHSASKCI